MTVTIKDIAEQAGVSFSTVSKALRNSPLVQETTKRKILKIAEGMGYVPNIAARKLVSKKSGAFGVIWPTVERATLSALMTKTNDLLEELGFTTLISINRMNAAIEAFNRFQVDAILLFDDRIHSFDANSRIQTDIPILYYGVSGAAPYPTIDAKRRKSIGLAVDHLLALGHRSIAYIGGAGDVDLMQKEKVDAFREAMKDKGFEGQIVSVPGMETHDGYLAAASFLASSQKPTAVIGGSYDLSKGVFRAASELGVAVPEQLSIVSYDHIPQVESFEVPLTSVGVEIGEIAGQIAQSLIRLADGHEQPDTVFLEPVLIVRSSTRRPH